MQNEPSTNKVNSIFQNSFSQKLRLEQSDNSSFDERNLTINKSKQQLPLVSNQKLPEKRRLFENSQKSDNYENIYLGYSNSNSPKVNDKKDNKYGGDLVVQNKNQMRIQQGRNHDRFGNRSQIQNDPYRARQLLNRYTSHLSYPSRLQQPQSSQQSFFRRMNQSRQQYSPSNRTFIQRRHNTSSRKSITISQGKSQQKIVSDRKMLKSPSQKGAFPYLHQAIPYTTQNMNTQTIPTSQVYIIQPQSQNIELQQYYKQRQIQHQKRQQQLMIQLQKQQIKTFSHQTRIPYYQKHLVYEPQVIMVPRQKIIEKHYTVENLIDYVPKVQEYVEGYDLIPREVIHHKLQYQLVQQRIVHLPKDQKWIGPIGDERYTNIRRRSKNKRNLSRSPHFRSNVDEEQQNIYSTNIIRKNLKSNQRTNNSLTKSQFYPQQQSFAPHLIIKPNNSNILTNQTLPSPLIQQAFQTQTQHVTFSDPYTALANQFVDRKSDLKQPKLKKYKQTYHVTSENHIQSALTDDNTRIHSNQVDK